MRNRKGFTLIELLAVIIILGILLLVAIPSVTTYINNSKKESYIATAKEYIKGATNLVNTGELDMFDPDTTYYIPNKCIGLETGGTSPYGEFDPAYIVVTYDNESYNYYWISRDTANMGVRNITIENALTSKLVEAGVKEIKPSTSIGARTKIKVLSETDCKSLEDKVVESSIADPSGEGGNASGHCSNGKTDILCKRATTLHTGICNASNMCGQDGHSIGGTVTFGQLGSSGSLHTGDAFDCDVNGDGVYDPNMERFYYVSSYFDTQASAGNPYGGYVRPSVFDDNYAVLIYFNNYRAGVGASETYGNQYAPTNNTVNGPTSALGGIPSTNEWCNVELKTTNRRILGEALDWHNNTSSYNHDEGRYFELPTSFSYAGKAARLLTAQEVMRGCGIEEVGHFNRKELLGSCKFMLENTEYLHDLTDESYENPDNLNTISGHFLETPCTDTTDSVFSISAWSRIVGLYFASTPFAGVRPTIEVPLSRIEY